MKRSKTIVNIIPELLKEDRYIYMKHGIQIQYCCSEQYYRLIGTAEQFQEVAKELSQIYIYNLRLHYIRAIIGFKSFKECLQEDLVKMLDQINDVLTGKEDINLYAKDTGNHIWY